MLYPVLQDPLRPVVSSLFDRPRGASIGQMLFSAGEQGAWYDPSDLSTLFQDSAGTTPVTAVEQPVGRILDKSGRGNHATQATTTKRPVLSRRVNRRSNSQGFTGLAAYLATFANITITDLQGINSGFAWFETTDTGDHRLEGFETSAGVRQRVTILLKPQGGVTQVVVADYGGSKSFFNLVSLSATPFPGATCTIKPLENGYFEITDERVWTWSNLGGLILLKDSGEQVYAGDPSRGIHIAGVDVRDATDAHLPYQRVNTATDYDADPAKFPAYLRFDGVDDALQTGNIDFTSTDKMTVWAGVLRASTGLAQEICGLTAAPGDAGAFTLWASTGGSAGASNTAAAFSSAISGSLKVASQTLTHNTQAILNGYQSIAGVNSRLNSGAINTVAAIPVANFANAPIYICSRAGTYNFLNGRLYSLIVRGAQSSLSQIEAAERYIKQKMRMP